jgi:hypothetical protein
MRKKIKEGRRLTIDLRAFVGSVFDTTEVNVGLVREDEPSWNEPLVSREQNQLQETVLKEEITLPRTENDVYFLHWESHLFNLALDHRDHPLKVICLHDLSREADDVCAVYRVDMFRSCLRCKHTQNPCTTAHVQNHLVLEEMPVPKDRLLECIHSRVVFQDLLHMHTTKKEKEETIKRSAIEKKKTRRRGIAQEKEK